MIEIELKLQVKEFPDFSKLECLKTKRVVDVYYDTKDYNLIQTGNFLRNRDNKKIDFKLNMDDITHTYCKETSFDFNDFKSNQNLKSIFESIGIEYNENFNDFESFVKANDLSVLATIDKVRKTYEFEDLIISLDDAKDIGKFIEIEFDLPDDAKFNKDEVTSKMIKTMTENNLLGEYEKVNIGYVELYLKKHNKKAYELGLYK